MEQKYDSFRVSAIFKDGTNVDNDIVEATGEEAVEAELEVAREWFREFDEEPRYFLISYYKDGEWVDDKKEYV